MMAQSGMAAQWQVSQSSNGSNCRQAQGREVWRHCLGCARLLRTSGRASNGQL